jgi:alpha-galactosidase
MRISLLASLAVLGFSSAAAIAQTPAPTKVAHVQHAAAPKPDVALTPPMGWNSWNYFAEKVTDKDIRDSADQIVASGMKDAGYIYVNIDDTWEGKRDENGVLHTNDKFPDMKALADYVHSKGLKIGIYSSPGPKTCANYEGSLGHEEQDAKMYAEWGIDYLKYDLCSFIPAVMEKQARFDRAKQMVLMHEAYDKMSKALKATGRPIVLSLCQYGWDAVWEWAPALGGNAWRTTGDIEANWNSMYAILSQQAGLEKYAGPGHWNDPDMLEVGNGHLNVNENRTHFAMWAMLSAPLLAGNDLPHMRSEIREILTNKDVIALDQDKLGKQASRIYSEGEVDVWLKHLSGGAGAIAIVNAGSERLSTHPFHLSLAKLGLHGPMHAKDLWTGKDVELRDNMPIEIKSHDVLLLRVAAAK